MLFKVYAQNCVRPTGMRVLKVDLDTLDEAVLDVVNTALNEGLVDCTDIDGEIDYTKLNEAHEKVWNYWIQHRTLSVGDWMLVEANYQCDVVIPNMCPSDAYVIF